MGNGFESEKYPGIDVAYPLALESYQWASRRFDAMDSRIQTILGLGMSLTLAAPAIFSALKLQIKAGWFKLAIVFFILGFTLGIIGRLKGRLTIITPKMLFSEWLHFSELEFKKNLIYFSGQHLELNRNLIAIKHRFLVATTIIFFLEVLCLLFSTAFPY